MDDDSWLVAGPTAPDEVRRYYDDWSPDYDRVLASWGYDAPQCAAQLLVGHASSPIGSVLDAGCGTGLAGAALRATGITAELVGIDLSDRSLELAAARGAYDELAPADLQRGLPFPDGRFDAAICVGVLTYVPDTEAIWRELARVVRAGGTIVCTQRADVWDERGCAEVADRLERDATWVLRLLTEPRDYMPDNPEFGHEIGVRYVVARIR